jgi:hypothetical protein
MSSPNPLLTAVRSASADLAKLATELESVALPSDTTGRVRKTGEALIAAATTAAAPVTKAAQPAGWPRDLATSESAAPAWGADPSEVGRG